MEIYTITIAPEASDPFLHRKAYKTLEEAKNAVRDEFGEPAERKESVYRNEDYTYFYIDRLEVVE